MVSQMTLWIEGIVEDDPLPDEVDVILFKTKFNGNYKFLEMLGFEKCVNENAFLYRTLEMQFFKSKELASLSDAVFYNRCKYLIDEAFSSEILQYAFKGRKIFFEFKQLEFLFVV